MEHPAPPAVVRGLVYTHNRANANTAELHEACSTLHALADLLIERGVLDRETLEARRRAAAEQLRREYIERGMAVAMQEFPVSKYEFRGGPEIDCEDRLPLCKASCCKLPLALSKEDVQEGIVRWELGRPYMIAQTPEHYCVHLDTESHHCGVYAQRPIPCRGYDCRQDKRIWLDFEKRLVNPRLDDPDFPECLEREMEQGQDVA
jgi:Fe-S-cluster containining protein